MVGLSRLSILTGHKGKCDLFREIHKENILPYFGQLHTFAYNTRQHLETAIHNGQNADEELIKNLMYENKYLDAAEKTVMTFIEKYCPEDIPAISELLHKTPLDT